MQSVHLLAVVFLIQFCFLDTIVNHFNRSAKVLHTNVNCSDLSDAAVYILKQSLKLIKIYTWQQ